MWRVPGIVTVLTIAGSLRGGSSNANLLRAAAKLAPKGLRLVSFDGVAALPHFNPDLDVEPAPPPVAALRAAVADAAALVISSPEYAHGVPGALKNALDWLVSGTELSSKPVLLMNASPSGGEFAQGQLAETLRTMSADVLM